MDGKSKVTHPTTEHDATHQIPSTVTSPEHNLKMTSSLRSDPTAFKTTLPKWGWNSICSPRSYLRKDCCCFVNAACNGGCKITQGNMALAKSLLLSSARQGSASLYEQFAQKTNECDCHIQGAYLPSKVCFL